MTLHTEDSNQPSNGNSLGRGQKTNRTSASELVVEAITQGILTGRYVPGQRLIEADLTNELRVSRGPVREAFKRLSAERIINLAPHRGAYIRSFTRDEVEDTLLVMEVLMGLAADLAARNINNGHNRQHFSEIFNKLATYDNKKNFVDLLQERNLFYEVIIEISNNEELARLMPLAEIQLLRTQFKVALRDYDHFKEYDYIGKAILDENPQRAQRNMRKHLKKSRKTLCSLPENFYASIRD